MRSGATTLGCEVAGHGDESGRDGNRDLWDPRKRWSVCAGQVAAGAASGTSFRCEVAGNGDESGRDLSAASGTSTERMGFG